MGFQFHWSYLITPLYNIACSLYTIKLNNFQEDNEEDNEEVFTIYNFSCGQGVGNSLFIDCNM